jgi:hypothetical protein
MTRRRDASAGIPSPKAKKLTLTQQLAVALVRQRMEEADDGTD